MAIDLYSLKNYYWYFKSYSFKIKTFLINSLKLKIMSLSINEPALFVWTWILKVRWPGVIVEVDEALVKNQHTVMVKSTKLLKFEY